MLRLGAALAHFQHALPRSCPCPAVVTVHDLSFERDPSVMSRRDRTIFQPRRAPRRAARRPRADRLRADEARSRRPVRCRPGADRRHAARRRPRVQPGRDRRATPTCCVGAVQRRKNPRAAADAAAELGMRLVVVGPSKDPDPRPRARGSAARTSAATSSRDELVRPLPRRGGARHAVAVRGLRPAGGRGDGHGTPVVAAPDEALREVAGDAAVFVEPDDLAAGVRRALAERDTLVAAGLRRAATLLLGRDGAADARRLPRGARPRMKVSAVVISHGHREELAPVAARAPAAGRRSGRDRQPARQRARRSARRAGGRAARAAQLVAANVNAGAAATSGELVLVRQPGHGPPSPARSRRSATSWPRTCAAGPPGRRCSTRTGPLAGVPAALPDRRRHARPPHAAPPRLPAARAAARPLPPGRAPDGPVEADWMLGGFLIIRRAVSTRSADSTPAFGCTARRSTSATGWPRPVGSAGTCRAAVGTHRWDALTDQRLLTRRTLLALERDDPLRPQASRDAARHATAMSGTAKRRRRRRTVERRAVRRLGRVPQPPGLARDLARAAARGRGHRARPRLRGRRPRRAAPRRRDAVRGRGCSPRRWSRLRGGDWRAAPRSTRPI